MRVEIENPGFAITAAIISVALLGIVFYHGLWTVRLRRAEGIQHGDLSLSTRRNRAALALR